MSDQIRQDSNQDQAVDTAAHTEPATNPTEQDHIVPEEQNQAEEEAAHQEQANPLQAQLEASRKQAEDNMEKYLRVQADFDNFRRRSRQEKEEFARYASAKLVEALLPSLDNMERAIDAGKDSNDLESLMKGIEMTRRQLYQVLEQEGLQQIEAAGHPFNPEFHQAVMQVDSEEHGEGIVAEELQKGYRFKDRVLRPAMVKVTK